MVTYLSKSSSTVSEDVHQTGEYVIVFFLSEVILRENFEDHLTRQSPQAPTKFFLNPGLHFSFLF